MLLCAISGGAGGTPPHHTRITASHVTYALLPVAVQLIELSGGTPRDDYVIDICQSLWQSDDNMEQNDIVFVGE